MKIKILLGVLSILAIAGVVFMANDKNVGAQKVAVCGSGTKAGCQCKNLGISSCGAGSSCRVAGSTCGCAK